LTKEKKFLIDTWNGRSIWSPLGGHWSKLRCYIILYHINRNPLDSGLQEYCNTCIQNIDRIVESIDTIDDMLIFCILIDIDIALDTIVMQYIDLVNAYGQCVLRWYWAVNTEYPSQDFLNQTRDYLHKLNDQWKL